MKAGELREIFQDDNLAQQVALAQQIFDNQDKSDGPGKNKVLISAN